MNQIRQEPQKQIPEGKKTGEDELDISLEDFYDLLMEQQEQM